MTKEFVFQPYIGTNVVQFGMSPDDVLNLLGQPVAVDTNVLKERSTYRVQ